jgi:uncharacterized protein YbjT (DUF2867 family)
MLARALTRNPGKPAARTLADQGPEVVAGELGDAESVRRALAGWSAVFCVTQFYEAGYAGEVALVRDAGVLVGAADRAEHEVPDPVLTAAAARSTMGSPRALRQQVPGRAAPGGRFGSLHRRAAGVLDGEL